MSAPDADEGFAGRGEVRSFYRRGGSGPLLLLIHGAEADHGMFDALVELLAPRFTVVAYDQRDSGRTTNGDAPYAGKVLARLGLGEMFEAVHDIHATQYRPKPDPAVYRGLCDAYDLDPEESLFVEDMARNLKPAGAIGMTTVWIDNGSEQTADRDRSFIDYRITDLGQWLHEILED